jgi:integrase
MSENKLPVPSPQQGLLPNALEQAGQAANQAAARHRFSDYRSRRAVETIRRQDADLALFAEFLYAAGVQVGELNHDPFTWRGITWGLVEGFSKWQLKEGYAVSTVNVRLSTVKTYARLAFQAGVINPEEYALIRSVQGYSRREMRRIDAVRPINRVGLKKESPVAISPEQAIALKTQPLDTPQNCRDALLMCLLLDHGLRVGEVVGLKMENLDLTGNLLRFYRPKVGKAQVHRLSRDTFRAASAYMFHTQGIGASFALILRSRKNGNLTPKGMSERSLSLRVNQLGKQISLFGLSPHDCRHYWATTAARSGTDPFSLQEAGGWSSLEMPRRYVEDSTIANQGVKLQPDE